MKGTTLMDRERLAAFVDGELSPEEAAEVVLYLADHPEDQAWVDDLMAANTVLAQAFAAPMAEPVPPAILAAIGLEVPRKEAQVVPFRRARGVSVLVAGAMALAATVAGVVVTGGLTTGRGVVLAIGPVAAESALAQVLDEVPTGSPQRIEGLGEVTILATMPTADGYCRELEVMDQEAGLLRAGLACSVGGGDWDVAVLIEERMPELGSEDGFAAASGTLAAGLTPFLDQVGAGMILTPQAEAEAIAGGWRP
jgi:hypothetical protein